MGGSAATTGADAGGAAAFAESAGSRALGVGHAAGSPEGLDAVSARVDRALDPRLPADFKKAKAAIAAECALSPREVEVFDLLATGRSPKRISEKLFVSESTVKSHCYRIYRKMGIHSQQELLDVVEDRVEQLLDNRWKLIP